MKTIESLPAIAGGILLAFLTLGLLVLFHHRQSHLTTTVDENHFLTGRSADTATLFYSPAHTGGPTGTEIIDKEGAGVQATEAKKEANV